MGVSCGCARSTAHDTRPTQADIIPPATRWSTYTHPDALHLYQILPTTPDAVQVSATAYYNKVYIRVQRCYGSMPDSATYRRPCQPGGVNSYRPQIAGKSRHTASSTDHAHLLRGSASPPVQGQPGGLQSGTGQRSGRAVWHPPPGGAVQRHGRGGRRGTIGGYRRIPFRAFAR